tara:strand:+ start:1190 stop:2059 length:870 start_codon:yes stop_codon:yes gene_type:complete
MKEIRITFLLLLLTPLMSFSQVKSNFTKIELRKNQPAYIGITMGFSSSNFRDFATSPLIYRGLQKYVSFSKIRSSMKKESEIGLSYSFGNYKTLFNEHLTMSSVKTYSLDYSQLYEFNQLSSENLNVKLGGLLSVTGNLRMNESLLNNATGVEVIPTLFGSVKITKDISRKNSVEKKFLFIKYRLKEQNRNLAFRLNIGLVNSSYRNGYVYSGQSAVLNSPKLLDDYEFKMFSGFRVSSALDYTLVKKNKNKIQISYLWGAYKTGGNLDKFEMAYHAIKLTFLFNNNNK